MKLTHVVFFLFTLICLMACQLEKTNTAPSIFLVKDQNPDFTSVEALRNIDMESHQSILWRNFILQAENDLKLPYIEHTIDFEGRSPIHLKHKNVSYDLARGVCKRLSQSALLFMVTEEEKYIDLVMQQIEALYDTTLWPMWCDDAHVNTAPNVDIRTF